MQGETSEETLKRVEEEIRELYRMRVEEKGATAEGIFWDDESSMRTRFEAALDIYDFEGKNILDVGCGFGDFYGFFEKKGIQPEGYRGVDISEEVLEIAKEKYPEAQFENRNVLIEPFKNNSFDITVLFGTIGHKLGTISNEKYLRLFMRTCFGFSSSVLINALSDYRAGDWPFEEFIYYYSPEKAFGYAQELTNNVVLKHDYEPIPQKEFHLLLGPGKN